MRKKKWFAKLSAVTLAAVMTFASTNPMYTYAEGGTAAQENKETKQFDVTNPVIESVEFLQNKQTVKVGDTLTLYVKAYDAESAIERVEAVVYIGTSDQYYGEHMTFVYDEPNQRYVGTYQITDSLGTTGYISGISAIDKNGNQMNWNSYGTQGELYTFDIQDSQESKVAVKEFIFPQNGQVLDEHAVLSGLSLRLEQEIPDEYVEICFENEAEHHRYTFSLWKDGDRYVNTEETLNFWKEGLWTLRSLECASGTKIQMADMKNYRFTLKKSETFDREAPVITEVSLDKQGTVLKAGEQVTVTVKAKDNVGLNEYASLCFQNVNDIEWSKKSKWIELSYDVAADEFRGTFTVDETTYPGEWYVSSIGIRDTSENEADTSSLLKDDPFYVQVMNNGTVVNPTHNITFSFMIFDKNNGWKQIKTVEKKNVERRTTLKDAGIVFPEMNAEISGCKQVGWIDASGRPIAENTQILSDMHYVIYAKYEQVPVSLYWFYLDEHGTVQYKDEVKMFPYGTTFADVKAVVQKAKAPAATYPGLKFEQWTLQEYGMTDDTVLTGTRGFYITAQYDKNLIRVTYGYVNKDHELGNKERMIFIDKGKTYGDLYEQASTYLPSDMTDKIPFSEWKLFDNKNQIIPEELGTNVYFGAAYKGKAVVVTHVTYYDKTGRRSGQKVLHIVNPGTTGKEIVDDLKNRKYDMYPGLRLKTWYNNIIKDEQVFAEGDVLVNYLFAEYENCLIRYFIDPMYAEQNTDWRDEGSVDDIFCQVAEKGEKITIKRKFAGYENVKFVAPLYEGDSFEVVDDVTFYGYGTKNAVTPQPPIQPETPVQPSKPSVPDNSGTTLPNEVVHNVVNTIEKTPAGESVVVDMADATVISKEILESAKGKDVDVKLNFGEYTWTINGKDIKAEDLKNINLEVKTNTKAIPSKTVAALAGNNPTKQLSLTHNGDFGFKAKLTVNVGSEFSGKYGNLYYYDSDGKMVFMNAGKINPDGTVSLEFSHASEYVIVMSDKKMSQADVPTSLQPVKKGAVATGDEMPLMTMVLLMVAAILLAGRAYLLKKEN